MKKIIELKNLSFTRKKDFQIKELSLAIPEGKITTLVGPNGSGKSTILRLMMNLLSPERGEVLLQGKKITTYSAKRLAQEMTMLSQSPDGLIDVVVHDLVAYGRLPHKKWLARLEKEDEEAIHWAISVCNLEQLAYRPLHTLSGGERQRAWLAMALAQKTPVLLLDEPTTYLDISHQLELLDLLTHLNKKYQITIVLVLHDLNQASFYSDFIIACQNGSIVKQGAPKEVFTQSSLASIFHIQAELNIRGEKLTVQPLTSTRFK
ncbi:ABC transporter ATP-binding protein [Listeria sp. PSOL-1]|uniref:ABC transporter ATP-binding protein n=1 Tax=Listeria sp. PSOL-1 TaxID=1844999 RepID=UPI0013D6396D|nr:ABC transporter ATP-binding protein [Listeria sp. PSOL-1]